MVHVHLIQPIFPSHLRDNISMYVRQELVESSLLGPLTEFFSTNKTQTTDYWIPSCTVFLSHLCSLPAFVLHVLIPDIRLTYAFLS